MSKTYKSKMSDATFRKLLENKIKNWKIGLQPTESASIPDIEDSLFDPSVDTIYFPINLSPSRRRSVHMIATLLELYHRSVGNEGNRQLVINYP